MSNPIFPLGQPLPSDWFTGEASLTPLVSRDHNHDFSAGCVRFKPGARTNWHTHPRGQVLIVIEGSGWYQEKDASARAIKVGDVVNIPEGVKHWHGASADQLMAHIAITNYKGDEQVKWLEPVTDEEYRAVHEPGRQV
jgi:quercetin dioxygenase-like cupin family protein